MSKAIVFIADGLEECEGLLVVDILRRAGTEVVTASVNGTNQVFSSHGITFFTDTQAEEADYDHADIVILPGGLKGTENLSSSDTMKQVVPSLPFVQPPAYWPLSASCAGKKRPSTQALKHGWTAAN